eukprot:SAG11_NODE_12_length_27025_cov_37.402681_27_plen_62_part_00
MSKELVPRLKFLTAGGTVMALVCTSPRYKQLHVSCLFANIVFPHHEERMHSVVIDFSIVLD